MFHILFSFFLCFFSLCPGEMKQAILFFKKRGPIFRQGPHAQRYKDSNLEMTESESVALPFGDSAMIFNARAIIQYVFLYCKPFFNFFQEAAKAAS